MTCLTNWRSSSIRKAKQNKTKQKTKQNKKKYTNKTKRKKTVPYGKDTAKDDVITRPDGTGLTRTKLFYWNPELLSLIYLIFMVTRANTYTQKIILKWQYKITFYWNGGIHSRGQFYIVPTKPPSTRMEPIQTFEFVWPSFDVIEFQVKSVKYRWTFFLTQMKFNKFQKSFRWQCFAFLIIKTNKQTKHPNQHTNKQTNEQQTTNNKQTNKQQQQQQQLLPNQNK